MSTIEKTGRRAIRQELRSTRSGTSIVAAVIALIVVLYLATEVVLKMIGQQPLLGTPGTLLRGATQIDGLGQPLLIAIGVIVALIGLVLLLRALLPGIRGLHHTPDADNPTIIDDTVVAAALAKVIRDSANLGEQQVTVSVGRTRALARIQPTTGVAIDREVVRAEAQAAADGYHLEPPLRVNVEIDKKGTVA